MRTLIIEPHGDDALFSCYSFLRLAIPKTLLTIAKSRSSEGLRQHVPQLEVRSLEIPDVGYKIRPYNHHDVNRWFREGYNPWYLALKHELQLSQNMEFLRVVRDHLRNLDLSVFDLFLLPVGLAHPTHELTRLAAKAIFPKRRTCLYVESPYRFKKHGRQLLQGALAINPDFLSLEATNPRQLHKKKEKIIRSVYPDEASYFRFTYKQIVENNDLYYVHPDIWDSFSEMFSA